MLWKNSLFAVAAVVAFACVPARASLITNGGFETDDFSGWAVTGSSTYVTNNQPGYGPHAGSFFAVLGSVGTPPGTVSQTVTTTQAAAYTLTYYLASQGDSPATFSASWDGTVLPGSQLTNPNSTHQYVAYVFTVTGTGLDRLTFSDRDDLGYLVLDDVSLDPLPSSLPEPISALVLSPALAGLCLARRGRKAL